MARNRTVSGMIALILVGIPVALPAQSMPVTASDTAVTSVAYSVKIVRASTREEGLPTAVMDRLVADTILSGMNIEGKIESPTTLLLTWSFPTLASFMSWYRSASTQSLLEQLESASGRYGRLSTNLQMSRSIDRSLTPFPDTGSAPFPRVHRPND